MNRFGFSERKASESGRSFQPTFSGYPQSSSKLSLEPKSFNEPLYASVQKPPSSSNVYQRPMAFSTARKPQTGPKYDFPQSVMKSATRQVSYGMGENLFASAKKNILTPKQSGHNFAMPQSVGPSNRMSRGMSKGGKENARNFSDKEFLKGAQEEIFQFFSEYQEHFGAFLEKSQIVQLSLANVSRMFEFLFQMLGFEVTIKSGKDSKTSLDIVVPEMMGTLEYPFPLKKSDFVSFVGDRQRGTIYHILCFIIALVRQITFEEEVKLPSDFENDHNRQFDIEALKLFLEQDLGVEDADNEIRRRCDEITRLHCGTEEELEFLRKEIETFQKNTQRNNDQLERINDVPIQNAALRKEIQVLQDYSKAINLDIESQVQKKENFKNENEELKKIHDVLEAELKNVSSRVEGQSLETVREYKLSEMQIEELTSDVKKLQLDLENINDQIPGTENDILKKRQNNREYLSVIKEAYNLFFQNIKDIKTEHSPNFYQEFITKIGPKKARAEAIFDFFLNLKIEILTEEVNTEIDSSFKELSDILSLFLSEFRAKTVNFNHKSSEQLAHRNDVLKEGRLKTEELQRLQSQYETDAQNFEILKNQEESRSKQLTASLEEKKKEFLEVEEKINNFKKEISKMETEYKTLEKSLYAQFKENSDSIRRQNAKIKKVLTQKQQNIREQQKTLGKYIERQEELLKSLPKKEDKA